MPTIIYVEHNGTEHEVDVATGVSLMEGAVMHMVPGIEGDCGGGCACATCHVYLTPPWQQQMAPIEELEEKMLEFAYDVKPQSRLACQIEVAENYDGMRVLMPQRQY